MLPLRVPPTDQKSNPEPLVRESKVDNFDISQQQLHEFHIRTHCMYAHRTTQQDYTTGL